MRKFALVLLLGLLGPLSAEPFGTPKVVVKGERAELQFEDGTIIRRGQGARLQLVPGSREMILEKGAALFSSPKGAGGGLIRVGSAVVTLAYGDVEALNVNGTGKVICLTGKAQVRSTRDLTIRVGLGPGQMVAIPAGGTSRPEKEVLNLQVLIESSSLLKMGPLPSQALLERNAAKQKGPPPTGAPPGVNNEAITGAAMTTANITQQEALQAQQAARAAQEAAAAQQAVQAAQNAARIASARQLLQQQQAQQAASAEAARVAQGNQGNQGNAFGPGGNPNNPNNGGGNPNNGQGNQGQGNQGQGNMGQGNQGKPPNAPPGQNK